MKINETFADALMIAQGYLNPELCSKFQMTPISDSAQVVGGRRTQSAVERPAAACQRCSLSMC